MAVIANYYSASKKNIFDGAYTRYTKLTIVKEGADIIAIARVGIFASKTAWQEGAQEIENIYKSTVINANDSVKNIITAIDNLLVAEADFAEAVID